MVNIMEERKTITILTPTYNRAHTLKYLFDSLKTQTNFDFKWLIVDDGSTDNTKELVSSFLTKDFDILYKYKKNGGKHTALNKGIKLIDSPLVFIVDSDDYLKSNAIETIIKKYNIHKDEPDICGFSFLRQKPNGELLCNSKLAIDGIKDTYVNCRINNYNFGDMAEVWFTDKLREFPFPEYQNEKFIGEDTVWIQLSGIYNLYFYNDIIYISNYLADGITLNRRVHNLSSPNGCFKRAQIFLNANIKFRVAIKSMIQFQVYGRFANIMNKNLYKGTNRKLLFCLFFIPSYIIYKIWRKKYGKNNFK